jgi:hypothetical protein
MPRKVFVANEILTAADVNTNLMDQAVMVFDDSAARGSAIPSPIEGMVTYLKDEDLLFQYDGAAWGAVSQPGILQVVQTVKTDIFSASVGPGSTTAITGLTAAITPSSASSKLLINFSISGVNNEGSRGMGFILTSNGSAVSSLGDSAGSRSRVSFVVGHFTDRINQQTTSGTFLYSPASTSSQTIGVNLLNIASGTEILLVNRSAIDGDNVSNARSVSSLTVMEVAG